MKILPHTIVSQAEFDDIMGQNEGMSIGEITRPSEEGMRQLIDLWVDRIDNLINLIQEAKPDSVLIEKYFSERGFTYEDYKLLFRDIEPSNYDRYRVFRVLEIKNKHFLIDFTTHHEENFDDYLKAIGYFVKLRKATGLEFFFRRFHFRISIAQMEYHTYASGSTGSGKSQLLRQLFYRMQKMSAPKSSMTLILIDPHGDISKEIKTSHLNYENKERFILIDPELKSGFLPVINPLQIEWETEDDVVNHAQHLCDAIVNVSGSDVSTNMVSLLLPSLTLLIKRKGSTLLDLIDLMQDTNDELVELGLKMDYEPHRKVFVNYRKRWKQQKEAIVARLQPFLNFPACGRIIDGESTINLKQEMDSGKVIIFNLSQRAFGRDGSIALGRFIVSTIKSLALNRGKHRMPTFMYIDECQRFVSQSFLEILEEARKFGLHLVMANQSAERLGDAMDVTLSNTGVKLIGSNGSIKTLKMLAATTGTNYETLSKLKDFNFFIKTRDKDGQTIKPFDILMTDKSYTMTEEQEKEIDEYILEKYYVDTTKQIEETDAFTKPKRFEL